MGLWRGKVQSIFMGFYILPRADDKEVSTYQEKRYVQKKKKRRIIKCESYRKMLQETVYGKGMSIFLSLYLNFFGYSLGGYSHRERYRAPDRKKSTEER
jgi:hypothetical protein